MLSATTAAIVFITIIIFITLILIIRCLSHHYPYNRCLIYQDIGPLSPVVTSSPLVSLRPLIIFTSALASFLFLFLFSFSFSFFYSFCLFFTLAFLIFIPLASLCPMFKRT